MKNAIFFLIDGAPVKGFFKKNKALKQPVAVQKIGDVNILSLPCPISDYKKKKLINLNNQIKEALGEEPLIFTNHDFGALSCANIEKSGGQKLFNLLTPDIAKRTAKTEGININHVEVAVAAEGCDQDLLFALSDEFKYISLIGEDKAKELSETIYEQTGLSIPIIDELDASKFDIIIFPGKAINLPAGSGICIGFNVPLGRRITAEAITIIPPKKLECLVTLLHRPLNFDEAAMLSKLYGGFNKSGFNMRLKILQ